MKIGQTLSRYFPAPAVEDPTVQGTVELYAPQILGRASPGFPSLGEGGGAQRMKDGARWRGHERVVLERSSDCPRAGLSLVLVWKNSIVYLAFPPICLVLSCKAEELYILIPIISNRELERADSTMLTNICNIP